MNKKIIYIYIVFVLLSSNLVFAQESYPKDYFRSPIDSPIYLSGGFCTLRNDHFHSGIDITTYERENMNVLAAADGWVSRIKVSPFGYGKALYIDHPNGYTTVYGHLNSYTDEIGKYVKQIQYNVKSFEIDVFPKKDELRIVKGQLVALSGNTGGSSGPHVHFEIRDTKTEEIINPILFGIEVNDTIAPEIKQVAINRIYPNNFQANKTLAVINSNQSRLLNSDTIFIPAGTTGIDAVVNDYTTFKVIPFNPYEINLYINDEKYYTCKFEKFSFDKSKYVNGHLNYSSWWNYGIKYQRLYKLSSNQLYFYQTKREGIFEVQENKLYHINIEAIDLAGFSKQFDFFIMGINDTLKDSIVSEPKRINNYSKLEYLENSLSIPDELEAIEIGNGRVKVKYKHSDLPITFVKPCTIYIYYEGSTSSSKSALYYIDYNKNIIYAGGSFKGGYVSGNVAKPGIYFIGEDLQKPVIKPINITKKNYIKGRHLSFKIVDKLSGIDKYNLYFNNQWVLAEYDAKSDMITYFFDTQTQQGWQVVTLKVLDKMGNETIYTKKVCIKN
ncbi:MAG: M23 family metallopeptidase [Bacteroidota bacterium]|nr:M23 family metallopeptidase [Bacteroidota bacterium]